VTGEEVSRIITKEKYASLHPRATGMPYVTQQKSVYIGQEMGRLVMIAAIICIVVMLLMTRSLRGIVCPLLAVIGGVVITFGVAGLTQMYVDSTVLMIPAILAFAVAIAYNIHIFSYFNQRMRLHGKRKQAVVETVSEIGWSVVFCGLTTVISLMSFMVIPIRPMKCVGMTSSLTVLFVLFTTLLMAPVLLSFGKDKQPKRGIDGVRRYPPEPCYGATQYLHLQTLQDHRDSVCSAVRRLRHRTVEDRAGIRHREDHGHQRPLCERRSDSGTQRVGCLVFIRPRDGVC
jgi:Predicted exporters of the RND superfamily